jgi:ubiquinone/menaquinone biosynthesis C-methylase UbiE
VKNTQEVGLLFDTKAQSWDRKYRAHGPLAYRVGAFSALVAHGVKSGAAILDFGGGTGAIASALAHRGFHMTVCDLSEKMISAGKRLYSGQPIEWVVLPQDWSRLPFAEGAFDAIIASSVFEYLRDVDHVLAECRRILRPGGKLIFSVPNPAHPTRRFELYARPLAILATGIPGMCSVPKIGNYLRYLRVSRARFSAAGWRQKAVSAGFCALPIESGAPDLGANQALMYLMFA